MSLPGPRIPHTRHVAALLALSLVVAACVTAPGDGASPMVEPSATAAPAASPTAPAASASPPVEPVASVEPAASALPPSSPSPSPASSPSLSPSPPSSPTPAPRSETPSIGYLSVDGSTAFVQAITDGVRISASEAGIDLVECEAGPTRNGVKACALELAEAGVHGVISFQPFDDLTSEICELTDDAPTIGIIYDQGPCQVSLLDIDHLESGRLAGEAMGQLAAERWGCDVRAFVTLESGNGDTVGRARMDGYLEGYQEYCALPKTVRALSDAQHLVTAKTQVAGLLDKLKGKPILVGGVSDIAILGAMRAAADAGRENHLWYSGQLADPAIRGHIACDNHYIASVARFPERFGSVVVPTLVDAISGREVPGRIEAELQLVTEANVRVLFPDTPVCDE